MYFKIVFVRLINDIRLDPPLWTTTPCFGAILPRSGEIFWPVENPNIFTNYQLISLSFYPPLLQIGYPQGGKLNGGEGVNSKNFRLRRRAEIRNFTLFGVSP